MIAPDVDFLLCHDKFTKLIDLYFAGTAQYISEKVWLNNAMELNLVLKPEFETFLAPPINVTFF